MEKKPAKAPLPNDHTLISWKAPQFHYHKKTPLWFPIQAFVTLAVVVFFVLTGQYFVSIIVILGAIVIYQLAHQEPEVMPVIFTPQGINFNGKLYPFDRLKSFWIIESAKHSRLHLQPIDRFATSVSIPSASEDSDKIRDLLRHYLPERHDAEEDLADRLNRWLRI